MSAPEVQIREQDLSQRIASNFTLREAIVIPSDWGPVEPRLVTDSGQLWKNYSLFGKYERGMTTSMLEADVVLEKTNALWVTRAVSDTALYAGVVLAKDGGSASNSTLSSGLDDPESYTFQADELVLLYPIGPGAKGNKLYIRWINYSDHPDEVKTPGASLLYIYRSDNLNEPIEDPWLVSLDPEAKDGNGRNIYIETVMQRSSYLRAFVNPAATGSETVLEQYDSALPLGGGDDGSAISDGDMITAFDKMANYDGYPKLLLLDGGWATPAYQMELINNADNERFSIAVCSVPYEAEASADYLNDIVDYKDSQLNPSSKRATLYTGWVKVYQKDIDDYVYLSPSCMLGKAYADAAYNYEIWYPVGGWLRGRLNVLDVRRRFTKGELDFLYDKGINPIRFATGKGIAIWGQKTCYPIPSSYDRLNVVSGLIYIEEAMYNSLDAYLFELNGPDLWLRMRMAIEGFMNDFKARKGCYDFYVWCDDRNNTPEDIDNYRVNATVFVKFTKAAEYIRFTVTAVRTDMDFKVAVGLAGK